jgi:Zn-finger nucleic acid-binding protein
MEAGTINCPMCGAVTSTDAPQCQYCEAQLATVACPSCFAMMFLGSKHCPHCGAAYAREHEVAGTGRKCPRCRIEMQVVAIGDSKVLECAKCLGLWLNTQSFEKLCADKEQQSAVLGNAALAGVDRSVHQTKVNYVPCPECSQLMNRANFARCSGVIIDLCKQHGVWFDRNELSRIVEFIRSGGLEMSRAKEKRALEEERRQLNQEQLALDMQHSRITDLGEPERVSGIASASGLLKFLLG